MAIETFKQKSQKKQTDISVSKKYVIYILTVIASIIILSMLFMVDLTTYKYVKIGVPILMLIYFLVAIGLRYGIKSPLIDEVNIIIIIGLIVASIYVAKEEFYQQSLATRTIGGLGVIMASAVVVFSIIIIYSIKDLGPTY
jgi:hypothetical protein